MGFCLKTEVHHAENILTLIQNKLSWKLQEISHQRYQNGHASDIEKNYMSPRPFPKLIDIGDFYVFCLLLSEFIFPAFQK